MKLRRLLFGGFAVLAVVVLAVLGGAVWVVMSESGTRFALERAQAFADGALSVGTVGGRLADAVVLSDVRVAGDGFSAAIDNVEIDMDWSQLLAGAVTVDRLVTSIVRVSLDANDGSDAEPDVVADATARAPSLPLAIQIARASIEGVSIAQPDGEIATERVTLSAAAAGTQADVRRFETRVQGFYLSMQGQFDWSDGLALDAVLSWSGERMDRDWLGSVRLVGTLETLFIEQELLAPFDLEASGSVSIMPTPAVDLRLRWTDLSVPGFEVLASAEGSAEIDGSIDDFRLVIDSDLGRLRADGGLDTESLRFAVDLEVDNVVPGRWIGSLPGVYGARGNIDGRLGSDYLVATDDLTLSAVIGEQALEGAFAGSMQNGVVVAERIQVRQAGNRVEATGRIGAELDLKIDAVLDELAALAELARSDEIATLVSIDPRVFALRGDARASIRVTGDWHSPALAGDLQFTNARYFDLPFALAATLARRPDDELELAIEAVEASLGATTVTGRGSVGSRLDLALDASLDDLGEIASLVGRDEFRSLTGLQGELAPLEGRADLSLEMTGPIERPSLIADLSVLDLSYDRWVLDHAVVDIDFDSAPGGRADLDIEADAPEGSLRLAATGNFGDETWRGRIERLNIQEPVLGAWTLEEPAALEIGIGLVDLERSCLRNVSSNVCLRGRYGTGSDEFDVLAESFDLATIEPLLPAVFSLDGQVDLMATLSGLSTDAPSGSLSLRSRGTEVGFGEDESARMTTIDSLQVDAALDAYALSLNAELEGPATGRAVLSMSSDDVRNSDAPISGSLEMYWSDLSAAAALTPDVGAVGGTLQAALNVSGSTRNPRVDGSAELVDGSISIPQWGVEVDGIDASAVSPNGRSLQFSGVGFIEDGELRLSGTTELDPEAGWPTRLNLIGDAVPIVQRPDVTVIASPALDIDVALPRIDVSGRVVIPFADIEIAELPAQAVRISPDAVVHGREAAAVQRPLQVHADIAVELGDDVSYAGGPLRTDLTGSLRLNYQSGLSPTASGNVGVTGTYEAYGQTLQLERGQLQFAGPLDNPGLDIRAVRRIGDVTAGLRLSGTLREPEGTVFSEPAMREADALAYLLFGRPIRASDEESTAALEATAIGLGLQQALPIVQQVGDSLGLDELTIGANEVDSSALMAGKYLSPRVYLSYTYGLFNRLGGFLLRYDINERFSLETRSGSEKSMDLLYTVEKD